MVKSLGGRPGPGVMPLTPRPTPAKVSAFDLFPNSPMTPETKLRKKEKKAIKRATKAAMRMEQAITSADLDHIWTIIHPDCERGAALKKPEGVSDMKSLTRLDHGNLEPQRLNFDTEVARIMESFNIPPVKKDSKVQLQLLAKLRTSINEDLVQFYREDMARLERQKEFCAWVARRALEKELEHGTVS